MGKENACQTPDAEEAFLDCREKKKKKFVRSILGVTQND